MLLILTHSLSVSLRIPEEQKKILLCITREKCREENGIQPTTSSFIHNFFHFILFVFIFYDFFVPFLGNENRFVTAHRLFVLDGTFFCVLLCLLLLFCLMGWYFILFLFGCEDENLFSENMVRCGWSLTTYNNELNIYHSVYLHHKEINVSSTFEREICDGGVGVERRRLAVAWAGWAWGFIGFSCACALPSQSFFYILDSARK